jgi:predicted DNA-binding antitoxin AbrB/MazE fold protein
MSQTVLAIYENGVFRPLEPIVCKDKERVVLTVKDAATVEESVLDRDFLAYCETQADDSVSVEAVRQVLAKIPGSLTEDIRAERDEE